MSINLDAAQALADAATAAPWVVTDRYQSVDSAGAEGYIVVDKSTMHSSEWFQYGKPDAEFIAQARTLVPALIAELREAREELNRWVENERTERVWRIEW